MSFWEALGASAASVGAFLGICSASWRYIIMPNIRAELVAPVTRVEHQVTRNGGANNPPTLPDKVARVDAKADLILDRLDRIDKRLETGDRTMGSLDARLEAIEKRPA